MPVALQLVKEDEKDRVRNLLNEYLVELSAFGEVENSYPYFDAYWTDSDCRWPYFIIGHKEIVGFAFVNTFSPSGRGTDFSMAEFYIQPSARGKGYGIAAAMALMLKSSGLWELSIMRANKPAHNFWPKVISEIEGRHAELFQHEGDTIHRFSV